LGVAAAAGGTVGARAPRLLGRFTLEGLQASLETATPGTRLLALLTGAAPRAEKLAAVERVAGWIEAVARETRGPETALDMELARLAGAVVPRWPVPADLADRLRSVPSVVEHGDLWPDNVVIDGTSFGLLDWEGARLAGLPLWDLLYFLTAALALVDGTHSEEEHFTRLFRGELASSAFLFEWTRRVAAASGVADDAVPLLATLRLLALTEIDLEHGERTAAVGVAGGMPLSVRLTQRWLEDPALGLGWDTWRA
jgi:aminoglycoside phosphotransferase (APT) family kinase protein